MIIFFIIRPRYQLVFSIEWNWTYVNWINPHTMVFLWCLLILVCLLFSVQKKKKTDILGEW